MIWLALVSAYLALFYFFSPKFIPKKKMHPAILMLIGCMYAGFTYYWLTV